MTENIGSYIQYGLVEQNLIFETKKEKKKLTALQNCQTNHPNQGRSYSLCQLGDTHNGIILGLHQQDLRTDNNDNSKDKWPPSHSIALRKQSNWD